MHMQQFFLLFALQWKKHEKKLSPDAQSPNERPDKANETKQRKEKVMIKVARKNKVKRKATKNRILGHKICLYIMLD